MVLEVSVLLPKEDENMMLGFVLLLINTNPPGKLNNSCLTFLEYRQYFQGSRYLTRGYAHVVIWKIKQYLFNLVFNRTDLV